MGLLKFARHPGVKAGPKSQSTHFVFRKQNLIPIKRGRAPTLVGRGLGLLPLLQILLLLMVPVLAASSSALYAKTVDSEPILISVKPSDWELAQSDKFHASLQVLLPTNSLQRRDSILSDILFNLPVDFPDFKLNTIGRGLHSSLVYLPDLSLAEIEQLVKLLTSLDATVLNSPQYDLLRAVQVFDADHIDLKIIGHENLFLALKPHREFVQWQMRFWRLIEAYLPELAAKHRIHIGGREVTEDGVHLSLIQWGKGSGRDFSDAKIEGAKRLLQLRIAQAVKRYQATHGGAKPSVLFDFRKISLELVTAPLSIQSVATPILSFRANSAGRIESSEVGRVRVSNGAVVEFNVKKLLNGGAEHALPYDVKSADQLNWMGPQQKFPALSETQFLEGLPPALRSIISEHIRLGRLSPTRFPAPVPTDDPASQNRYFVTTMAHPMLAPEKGIPVLKVIEKMGLRSTADTFIGTVLYASSVRKEVLNPGDSDVLINSLVMVPANITTFREAQAFAVDKFIDDVLGQFARLERLGRGSFTELRIGSDVTMGLPFKDIVDAYEDNPYLSQLDIRNKTFRDKSGKLWSLHDLIALGDFTKGKMDFYPEGLSAVPGQPPRDAREDISLQFLIGFHWNGNTYALQRNGMKGVPSLLRTAVSGPTVDDPSGLVSYAVGAAISHPLMLSSIQRGSLLPFAVRDIQTYAYARSGGRPPVSVAPLWNPKFIKKVYNFMILLFQGGLSLDEYFFKQVKGVLSSEGRWNPHYSLVQFKNAVISAINPVELGLLNTLRRNINDYREYNERHWALPHRGWRARVEETSQMMVSLDENIKSGILKPNLEFQKSYAEFRRIFNFAKYMSTDRAVRYFKSDRFYDVFKTFENQLKYMESEFVSQRVKALSQDDKLFVETLVAYAPHILVQYMDSRSQESDERMLWSMQVMKMNATPTNLALMRRVSRNFVGMPRAELATIQSHLFRRDANAPLIRFSGNCQDALANESNEPNGLSDDDLGGSVDPLD